MGFLLNRRNAFRSSELGSFSSWKFDITKSTFDNVSKTIAATYFRFLRIIDSGANLVCAGVNGYVYKYAFETGHEGEINYLADSYAQRSANTNNSYSFGADISGKHWLCSHNTQALRVSRVEIDSSFDVASIPLFNVSASVVDDLPSGSVYSTGLAISNDGTKVYRINSSDGILVQHTLTTPFLLSSASLAMTSVYMTSFGLAAAYWVSFAFSPDGYRMVFVGENRIHVFDLSVPWDISTMSLTGAFTSAHKKLQGVCVNDDATKMYVSSGEPNAYTIYQYSLSQ